MTKYPYLRWFITPKVRKQLRYCYVLHYTLPLLQSGTNKQLTKFYRKGITYDIYLYKCTLADILEAKGVAISCREPLDTNFAPYVVLKLLIPGVSKTSLFEENPK